MSTMESTFEKFTYFWEIKNPRFCSMALGEFIESPKFCVPQFHNTEWYLRLYPCGDSHECKGKAACFMYRGNDNGPDDIELNYTLRSSYGRKIYSSNHSFTKDYAWGYPNFIPHSLDFCKKPIVIIWEIYCKLLRLNLSEEEKSFNKSGLTFPVKCFTQTKFLGETKSIQRFIDPLISSICSKITIPLILPENYPSLIMTLKNTTGDIIVLEVSLMNDDFKESLKMICDMNIINSVGQLLYSFEEEHTFVAGRQEKWCFNTNFSKELFKTYLSYSSSNTINFKGDFSFSIGQTVSKIVSVEEIKVSGISIPFTEYIPANEMFRLYKEKELCDFSLKVGSKTYDVHKVVLGAASPVLSAMFKNDMIELKSNTVEIVDIDQETVEQMIFFMYTGSVKDMDYEMSKKLFKAADKYQISPLLDLVRNVIVGLMNSDTICDIILLADIHDDEKLIKKTVDFIKLNKSTILNTSKWAMFETENIKMATKILRQVCLLNKRKRAD